MVGQSGEHAKDGFRFEDLSAAATADDKLPFVEKGRCADCTDRRWKEFVLSIAGRDK